ncbi:probably inactive leucine-rich repeat receptor-like protein kinase At3g28040 precursor [Elaeis guineensis]|uniref:Receptor-like protein kinase n=1 Tax=Elaeis guineensis var. tenera TaxID=51953 RepID=Q84XU7_ELAGV|nr:probably inactive leucine-rich repeat receptor-like protein kinase At3g28040 precursor [Elaeis guineensis]AAO26311.1 receptor-like protein kinase [Elaeis guineensis]
MMSLLLRIFYFVIFLPFLAESRNPALNDDVLGLIVFKADLREPDSKLVSWNEDDDEPCCWTGIKCEPKTNRVTELSLNGFSLSGKIGRGLLQLQSLRTLSLSKNNFSGTLSSDLLRLESLRNLDLSENKLSGPIPDDFFGQCRSIRAISLAKNAFFGAIPSNVGFCSTLAALNLSSNRLSGSLPWRLWSLNALRSLDLSDNTLVGEIPVGISKMYNLRSISLHGNRLSGHLPDDIGDCLLLKSLDLAGNSLSGSLPESMRKLSTCSYLSLSSNFFSGEVPTWIGEMKSLETLDLSRNGFFGQLPGSLGDLQLLKALKLSRNGFTGSFPESLCSCKSLVDVDLSQNSLTGKLPLWVFESGLQQVLVSENKLNGSIVIPSSSASNLQVLVLSSNAFSGSIPEGLGKLKSLEVLDLSGNRLNGSIPLEIGGAVSLKELRLEKNSLKGAIPTQIGNCASLTSLDLSQNNLTGPIPPTLANLTNLQIINFSRNRLTGTIPKQLSNLPHLLSFNIAHNVLSGDIPSGSFFNTIPPSFLSDNPGLCGSIVNRSCPGVLPKPIVLNPENSSPNSSSGSTFSPSGLHHKKIILSVSTLIAIGAAAIIALGVITITVLNFRARASASQSAAALALSDDFLSQSPTTDANSGKLIMFAGGDPEFSAGAHALLNKDCELGRGGFGAVYKTMLQNGRPVAIKKLTVSSLVKSQEDFEREVKKLGKVQHPNLVALEGYYWTPSLQLLIYEFVSGGSLYKHLHESSASNALSWQERFDIILGTAKSLAHLHRLDIIHYNLKSAYILLDGSGEPKTGDYGLAKLLPMLDHYVLSSKIQSALGYMAPEFACRTVKITEKCDVYAFGVLVLEIQARKRLLEYMEDDVVVLCDMVRGALEEGKVAECVDGRLMWEVPHRGGHCSDEAGFDLHVAGSIESARHGGGGEHPGTYQMPSG